MRTEPMSSSVCTTLIRCTTGQTFSQARLVLCFIFVTLFCTCHTYDYHQTSSSGDNKQVATLDDVLAVDPHEVDTFRAIRTLHTKLDVDADGEVDDAESKQFLESEGTATSGNIGANKDSTFSTAHKLRYLHQDGKDRSISVDELWQAWKSSNVYNWTIDETVYWLVNYVELPEYSHLFEHSAINGSLLPRLAADSQFINRLGISDPSAKKKISIKAMDVVLFGPPKLGNSSKVRDIIVGIVTLIAVSACCFFYKNSIAAKKALRAVQENLDSLQRAEDQMQELEQELEKAKKAQEAVVTEKRNLEHQLEMQRQLSASTSIHENSASKIHRHYGSSLRHNASNGDLLTMDAENVAKLEDEVKTLRKELDETLSSIEAKKFRAPFPLRTLLRATYDIESQYYNEKKLNLESKATEVKIRNQKLQKKKTSFLGYYKMAQENSLEEDINTIVEIKEAIMQVTRDIKERTQRWRAIEELCGCSLDLTPPMRV